MSFVADYFVKRRCDAEPEALATYVLALLKHDAPENELKAEVTRQLDEFFEDGSFYSSLFCFTHCFSCIWTPYADLPHRSLEVRLQPLRCPPIKILHPIHLLALTRIRCRHTRFGDTNSNPP